MLGFKAEILWEGWRTGGVGALEEWGNGGEGTRGVENWRGRGLEGWGTGGGGLRVGCVETTEVRQTPFSALYENQ